VELGKSVLAAVAEAVGRDVELRGRTALGESGTTFLVDEDLVLKVVPDVDGALANQGRLVRVVGGLRARGYPAPVYVAVGRADGVVFTVQERLPGRPLEPAALESVLPQVLEAVELQAGAGDLEDPPWPGWLLETIEHGGDGYCLHSTMERHPDTQALLERLRGIAAAADVGPARSIDVLHFDLSPANILHVDGRLTGVVDWNVPFPGAAQGDRGFDVATLLFHAYGVDAVRAPLWDRAVAISGRPWTTVYLCHLVLRQVEWVRRHAPGSPEDERFTALAARVLDDCA
jgi:aminoglycoside phosphotransferase (APT) family kinase protein